MCHANRRLLPPHELPRKGLDLRASRLYNRTMLKPCLALFMLSPLACCFGADARAAGSAAAQDDAAPAVAPGYVSVAATEVPAETLRQWTAELQQALSRQLELVSGVRDAGSASAAVAPLGALLGEMGAMQGRMRADALRVYIDNTPDVKAPFIELLQQTAVQFKRLSDADFYGCAPLRALLAPQLGTDAGDDEAAAAGEAADR